MVQLIAELTSCRERTVRFRVSVLSRAREFGFAASILPGGREPRCHTLRVAQACAWAASAAGCSGPRWLGGRNTRNDQMTPR